MKTRFLLAVTILLNLIALPLRADSPGTRGCRLIVEGRSGKVIVSQGSAELRQSPCSTFKIPLAVMGYDSGILTDEHHPAWEYLPEYGSNRAEEQRQIDPTSWEAISVVWYSQKLTRALGKENFQKYIDGFNYGNRDLSGDPGKANGLTESWLLSSLQISAAEQVAFLQRLLRRELGVSDHAYLMTEAILPKFPAEDGWTVTGKTGSGFQRKPDGSLNRKMHEGWFVGWATKGDRRILFAERLVDDSPHDDYAGPRARKGLIEALPRIMAEAGRK